MIAYRIYHYETLEVEHMYVDLVANYDETYIEEDEIEITDGYVSTIEKYYDYCNEDSNTNYYFEEIEIV